MKMALAEALTWVQHNDDTLTFETPTCSVSLSHHTPDPQWNAYTRPTFVVLFRFKKTRATPRPQPSFKEFKCSTEAGVRTRLTKEQTIPVGRVWE